MTGAPYGVQLTTFLNPLGMPCWNPPYGSIAAYDLKTGEQLWDVPFGQVQQYGFYMPESWGSITIGGPVITASGLDLHRRLDGLAACARSTSRPARCCGRRSSTRPPSPCRRSMNTRASSMWSSAAGGNSILTPTVSDQVVAFALPD